MKAYEVLHSRVHHPRSPSPDVPEPLTATHSFPLPLRGNLGRLVHQNWGRSHTSRKLLHTLGRIIGTSLREGGQKGRFVTASGPKHILILLGHLPLQNVSSYIAGPLPFPARLPRELGVCQSRGTSLNSFTRIPHIRHTHLVGRTSSLCYKVPVLPHKALLCTPPQQHAWTLST